ALEALELAATPEARAVLRGLAQGAPDAWRTREAETALARLDGPAPAVAGRPGGDKQTEAQAKPPLPAGAVARLGTLRFRSPGWVYRVAFSRDGRSLVTHGVGGVELWDSATGRSLRRDGGEPPWYPWSAQLSADGSVLAALGQDNVQVWDAAAGK